MNNLINAIGCILLTSKNYGHEFFEYLILGVVIVVLYMLAILIIGGIMGIIEEIIFKK